MSLREALAEYAHQAWSEWMDYLFSRSYATGGDGTVAIPPDLVDRWERQAATPYADLPDTEKQSDLHQADKMLGIIQTHKAEGSETLVLEGAFSWAWDEILIGDADLSSELTRKWPKERFDGTRAFRVTIERLPS